MEEMNASAAELSQIAEKLSKAMEKFKL